MARPEPPEPSAVKALPKAPRSPRLDTGARVRCELARVYRLARWGHIDWGTATKAAHVLSCLARMLENAELAELAARLDKLETAQAAQERPRWAA